ncbi:FG-GAP repeat domain-containing protein [Streptomyces sp. NPDC018693]|uniref:FG-GAP repeat domain-containing protein n=1 Tax=unclassified Streptomyces TaxID=2593676 RepID=UPI0037BA9B50
MRSVQRTAARRRLATAVATVLALTTTGLGTGLTTAPATAAPAAVAATTGAEAQSVIPFPKGDVLDGATATGYLTRNDATDTRSWLPASGGFGAQWAGNTTVQGTGTGDLVARYTPGDATAKLMDMASGSTVHAYNLGPSDSGVGYAGAAGTSLFTTLDNSAGGQTLRMHSDSEALRTVAGLPETAADVTVAAGTAAHAQVTWSTGTGPDTKRFLGLLDLASGAVTETYELPATAEGSDIAVSATDVAWVEYTDPTKIAEATVVATERSTGTSENVWVGRARPRAVEIALQGDWLMFGNRSSLDSVDWSYEDGLTAYHLRSYGPEPRLLHHLTSAAIAPDGTLFARGGTIADNEGVYRIAPGEDGVPAATLVASTGELTEVTLTGHTIPAVVDLDRNGGQATLGWNLSRGNVAVDITLRHVRTGKTRSIYLTNPGATVRWDWQGDLGSAYASAHNGDYTWLIDVQPLNTIGDGFTASGTFKVVRTQPHDFDDNGTPNTLARDTAGRLWNRDTHSLNPSEPLGVAGTKLIGGGWNIYDRIETVGNVGGAAHADVIARDGSGVLWLYLGKGDGTLASRIKIGGGWQIYDKLTGGTDYTGDGKADLLATDTSGVLWLYKGTGNYSAPFATRVKVGGGWGIYNDITAMGNVGGAAAGDLLARDRDGVLWLYLGYGNGTFASRVRIGGGWNVYSDLVGIGDGNRDGRPDLLAYPGSRHDSYFYSGTGDWQAPFGPRTGSLAVHPIDYYYPIDIVA